MRSNTAKRPVRRVRPSEPEEEQEQVRRPAVKGKVVRPQPQPQPVARTAARPTPSRRAAPPVEEEEDEEEEEIAGDFDLDEEEEDESGELGDVEEEEDDADPDAGMVGMGEEDDDDFDPDEALDLSDVDEKAAFAPVAPGIYPALISGGEYGKSQRSGNPMITWAISVATDPEEGRFRTLYYHTVLNKDNLPRLKRMVVRVAPEYDMSRLVPSQLCEDLEGYVCKVRLKNRRFEGEMRPNISDILPPDEDTADFFEDVA